MRWVADDDHARITNALGAVQSVQTDDPVAQALLAVAEHELLAVRTNMHELAKEKPPSLPRIVRLETTA